MIDLFLSLQIAWPNLLSWHIKFRLNCHWEHTLQTLFFSLKRYYLWDLHKDSVPINVGCNILNIALPNINNLKVGFYIAVIQVCIRKWKREQIIQHQKSEWTKYIFALCPDNIMLLPSVGEGLAFNFPCLNKDLVKEAHTKPSSDIDWWWHKRV